MNMKNAIELHYYFKKSEILFFGAWILFLFSVLFSSTAFYQTHQDSLSGFVKGIRYCAYLIFCFKFVYFNTSIQRKSILIIVFAVLVTAVSCIASTNKTMFLYSFILLAAIGVDGSRFMKITVWIQGAFITIVIILSKLGILQDFLFGEGTERIRHGLGFSWTTTGPILFFYFMLGYIYLKKEKFGFKQACILGLFNILFFHFTDSRMAFLLSSAFLLFFTFISKNNVKKKIEHKYLFMAIPVVLCTLSIVIESVYNPESQVLNSLNHLLSNRLALGKNAVNKYGFSLLGQKIEWIGFNINNPDMSTDYNYVDSSYLQLTLEYGFFFIFIVIGIYLYGIYRAIKSEDRYLLYIYIIILLFALTEPRLMNFAFNPFPLLIFTYASEDKTCLNKKDIEESYG